MATVKREFELASGGILDPTGLPRKPQIICLWATVHRTCCLSAAWAEIDKGAVS